MQKNKKYKKDRALLQNTHGSAKSSFNKKKYKPGIHKSKTPFTSTYGFLLNQRQKLRAFFSNIKGKQMFKILSSSIKHKNYKEVIVRTLLSRLDSVLFRSGMACSFGMARQLVNHKKVYVNGIIVSSCSFLLLEDGAKVTFKESAHGLVKNALKQSYRKVPSYISVDPKSISLTIFATKYPKHERDLHLATAVSLDNAIRSYKL